MTAEAPARRFALIKIGAGDYLLPSNDASTLWRLQRYQDGSLYGLDVGYEARWFWRLMSIPMASIPGLERGFSSASISAGDPDDWGWRERQVWCSSRAVAIAQAMTWSS